MRHDDNPRVSPTRVEIQSRQLDEIVPVERDEAHTLPGGEIELLLICDAHHSDLMSTHRFRPEAPHDLRNFRAHVFVQVELHTFGLRAGWRSFRISSV